MPFKETLPLVPNVVSNVPVFFTRTSVLVGESIVGSCDEIRIAVAAQHAGGSNSPRRDAERGKSVGAVAGIAAAVGVQSAERELVEIVRDRCRSDQDDFVVRLKNGGGEIRKVAGIRIESQNDLTAGSERGVETAVGIESSQGELRDCRRSVRIVGKPKITTLPLL